MYIAWLRNEVSIPYVLSTMNVIAVAFTAGQCSLLWMRLFDDVVMQLTVLGSQEFCIINAVDCQSVAILQIVAGKDPAEHV